MKLRQFIEGQRKNRKSLSQTARLNMWKQAHGRCWYCGCDTPKTFFVLEHVEPFSRGGADSKRNLVVSCWQCDRDKGTKNLEEFRAKRGGVAFHGEQRIRLKAKVELTERQRRERKRKINAEIKKERMVRMRDAPCTIGQLWVKERGDYKREPYRF